MSKDRILRKSIYRNGKLIGEAEVRCNLVDANVRLRDSEYLKRLFIVNSGEKPKYGSGLDAVKLFCFLEDGTRVFVGNWLEAIQEKYDYSLQNTNEACRRLETNNRVVKPIKLLWKSLDKLNIMKKEYKRADGSIDAKIMVYQDDVNEDILFTKNFEIKEVNDLLTFQKVFLVAYMRGVSHIAKKEVYKIGLRKIDAKGIFEKLVDILWQQHPLIKEEEERYENLKTYAFGYITGMFINRSFLCKYVEQDVEDLKKIFEDFSMNFNMADVYNIYERTAFYGDGSLVWEADRARLIEERNIKYDEVKNKLAKAIIKNIEKYGYDSLYRVETDPEANKEEYIKNQINIKEDINKYAIDIDRGLILKTKGDEVSIYTRFVEYNYCSYIDFEIDEVDKVIKCIEDNLGFQFLKIVSAYEELYLTYKLFKDNEDIMEKHKGCFSKIKEEIDRLGGDRSRLYRLKKPDDELGKIRQCEHDGWFRLWEVVPEDVNIDMDEYPEDEVRMYWIVGKGWYVTNRSKEKRPHDYWMPRFEVYNDELAYRSYMPYSDEEDYVEDWIPRDEIDKYTNIRSSQMRGVPISFIYFKYEDKILPTTSEELVVPDNDDAFHLKENCWFCDCCENWFTDDESYEELNDRIYCGNCAENEIVSCEECGERMLREDVFYSENRDAYYCESCYNDIEAEDEANNLLEDYSYKPDPEWLRTSEEAEQDKEKETMEDSEWYIARDARMYFGVELELKNSDLDLVRRLKEEVAYDDDIREDWFYLKRDSSIEGGGFEMVTHPMSYQWIEEVGLGRMTDILQQCREAGARGHNHSGMHIHVSKQFIDEETMVKLYKFFEDCYNRDFLTCISQRKGELLSRWAKLGDWEGRVQVHTKKGKIINIKGSKKDFDNYIGYMKEQMEDGKCNPYTCRYHSLNMTGSTLEFRMFNSTIRSDRWMKNIQFVKSIIEFCKVKEEGKMKYTNYIAYIQRRKEEYKYVYQFIKEAIKREGGKIEFQFNIP